jgi:hypothetical protein
MRHRTSPGETCTSCLLASFSRIRCRLQPVQPILLRATRAFSPAIRCRDRTGGRPGLLSCFYVADRLQWRFLRQAITRRGQAMHGSSVFYQCPAQTRESRMGPRASLARAHCNLVRFPPNSRWEHSWQNVTAWSSSSRKARRPAASSSLSRPHSAHVSVLSTAGVLPSSTTIREAFEAE